MYQIILHHSKANRSVVCTSRLSYTKLWLKSPTRNVLSAKQKSPTTHLQKSKSTIGFFTVSRAFAIEKREARLLLQLRFLMERTSSHTSLLAIWYSTVTWMTLETFLLLWLGDCPASICLRTLQKGLLGMVFLRWYLRSTLPGLAAIWVHWERTLPNVCYFASKQEAKKVTLTSIPHVELHC